MKYPKKAKLCCPRCNGTGYVIVSADFRKIYSLEVRKMARKLHKDGIGYTEIGRRLGINHSQKVKSLINSK